MNNQENTNSETTDDVTKDQTINSNSAKDNKNNQTIKDDPLSDKQYADAIKDAHNQVYGKLKGLWVDPREKELKDYQESILSKEMTQSAQNCELSLYIGLMNGILSSKEATRLRFAVTEAGKKGLLAPFNVTKLLGHEFGNKFLRNMDKRLDGLREHYKYESMSDDEKETYQGFESHLKRCSKKFCDPKNEDYSFRSYPAYKQIVEDLIKEREINNRNEAEKEVKKTYTKFRTR